MVRNESAAGDPGWLKLFSDATRIIQRQSFGDTPTGIRKVVVRSDTAVVVALECQNPDDVLKLFDASSHMATLLVMLCGADILERRKKGAKRTRATKSAEAPKGTPDEPSSLAGEP